jgi:nucleotide-binding universal stress UspA family protein
MSVKKILWTTDGSENGLRSLPAAVYMAKTFQASLCALHVVNKVPMLSSKGFTPPAPMAFDVPKYQQALVEEMKKYLEKTIATQAPELDVTEYVVEVGNPAEIIMDFAKRSGVDLIVMSTHGRKGVKHMLLGSVAEEVIRYSPVPVMTVPSIKKPKK